MILIWTGKGYLVPLTTIGVLGVFGVAIGWTFGEEAWRENGWVWAIALTASATLTWMLGRWANRRPYRLMRDIQTGRTLKLKARNSFCFVAIEYWAVPLLVLAMVCLARDILGYW